MLSNFALWKIIIRATVPLPHQKKIILSRREMSQWDQIFFLWWMVYAYSNVIKKRRFCWLLPPWNNLVISLWQISNEKKFPLPTTRTSRRLVVTNFKWKKIALTPIQEHLVVSSWQISNGKRLPLPTTRTSCCLVVTNFKWKKGAPTPPQDNLVVLSWQISNTKKLL